MLTSTHRTHHELDHTDHIDHIDNTDQKDHIDHVHLDHIYVNMICCAGSVQYRSNPGNMCYIIQILSTAYTRCCAGSARYRSNPRFRSRFRFFFCARVCVHDRFFFFDLVFDLFLVGIL